MRKFQTLLAATCILFTALTFGQTKEIAFKSHSGNNHYFNPDNGEGNFGWVGPMPQLDSVVKINDSTVIKYFNAEGAPYHYDTIMNDEGWLNLDKDSMLKFHYPNVYFGGYEDMNKMPKEKTRGRNKAKPTKTSHLSPNSTTLRSGFNYGAGVLIGSLLIMGIVTFLISKKRGKAGLD